jgi:hypothetical protein
MSAGDHALFPCQSVRFSPGVCSCTLLAPPPIVRGLRCSLASPPRWLKVYKRGPAREKNV